MVASDVKGSVNQLLHERLNFANDPKWESIGGGSINQSYRVSSGKESVFIKINSATDYPGMFAAEANGLTLLKQHSDFPIPEVITSGEENTDAFLVMEWIESGTPAKDFWEVFAGSLAQMHRQSTNHFGLDHDNYIGSLPQKNDQYTSWAEFYINMRLEPQLRMAADKGLIGIAMMRSFDRLFAKLENLFPEEQPALLHGDLWRGNFLCHASGYATIFDPAIYYGHREMDLAMTKLFGGFESAFYVHYHRGFPLEKGWEERIPLGQLYPLLVHVNLFGAGYVPQVKSCLLPFV